MKRSKVLSAYMSEIGKKGGKARGSVKRRSTAHYKAASAKRWEKLRNEAKQLSELIAECSRLRAAVNEAAALGLGSEWLDKWIK